MNLIQTDKRRLIVGLGVTGKSCIRHFLRMGLSFSVLDTRENPPEMQAVAQEFPQVDIHLGKSHTALVDEADEIYLSPGIAIDDPLLTEAVSRGALVTGDIDLFAQQATAPVIAISGSNAKSTVTTLVGEMAKCANITAGVGGNLGEPVLDLLSSDCEAYVLELSSFQLERCADLKPQVACLLNISADHMDRHQTMMTYHQAKQRVYRGAKHIIFNRHDSLTAPLKTVDVSVKSFGLDTPDLGHYGVREIEGQRYLVKGFEPLMAVSEIPLVGDHHILNTLAALAIGEAAGFALPAMQMAVKQFKGLPHRCEFVADIDGVDYINDSKATNVGATVAALKGLSGSTAGHIVLIAGGQTKGADFSALISALKPLQCKLVLLGEGAAQIESLVTGQIEVFRVDSLEQAVSVAQANSQSGDRVLLSPACASFDMFDGFEQRGDIFKTAVNHLLLSDQGVKH
ncbi:MAG: UDP-N-acetylmuramoyl-L-alanine--D-glutamate ligase [Pseudomonadales bacterium]|nr:UDP-N-acetylmuramoyl-L-alanine--D-glutamate ligase [Pseudomonadales bacterium]